uniref:Uncharacterized protein n=2 Tax=Cuerna arida TaxID=1464854 RepID=A0A1B6F0Q7_9HEMI
MPDVTRSDSQRSDASHKPRVSFNRDVHVKRIGREGVVSALAGDGEGRLVPLPVRRERPGRLSRRELEKEAEAILRQAERVQCTPALGPERFSTLPPRPRPKHSGHPPASSIFNSLDRSKGKKKKPLEGTESVRLKRRYSNPDNSWERVVQKGSSPEHSSPEIPQRRKLNRSVSDAGRRDEKEKERTSIFGTLDRIRKKKKKPPVLSNNSKREEVVPPVRKKKQLSPIIEMSPKVEGSEPWRFASPTQGTVVYAEVVTRPGGKTTVHTAVPADSSTRLDPSAGSEEDEGVDMGLRGPQGRKFSEKFYENEILRSASPKEYTVDIKRELDANLKRKDNEIREDKIINMLRARSNPLLDEELVGGYRREVRTERVIRVEGSDDPDGRGRADGMDYNTKRRTSKDLLDEEAPFNSYFEDRKIHSYDDLDRIKHQEPIRAWTPPLETSLIDSNNLSYRRDRLESRLTNHKRRFITTAQEIKSYRDDKIKGEELRKDFMMSQMSDDKQRGYFEKKIATEIDTHHRQQMLKNKDVFADSGIEMSDYRKEPSKDVVTLNRRNAETTKITRTETNRTKSTPVLHKTDYHSDGEKRYKGDMSMKFIEEERQRRDVIPASSTLVKNYSKPQKEEQKTSVKKEEKITKDKKKDKLTRMDKVKQLMFGSKDNKKNKKKKKQEEEEEDLLRSRYTEYKGSDISVNSSPVITRRRQTSSSEVDDKTDQEREYYGSRQRLATPSPSARPHQSSQEDTWFKSLTRRNKHTKASKSHKLTNGHGEDSLRSHNKHLRFFGDSDRESVKSGRATDSSQNPHLLQVPTQRHGHSRRHVAPDSSAESTTEGDSSHSQKSVVYLHAATVGDIPGSRKLHRSVTSGGRRSLSREELSSNPEAITPQSRVLSRSISVLAPWRPRHNRQEVNYDSGGRPPRAPKRDKERVVEKKKSSRELRKSKENLIDYEETRRGSSDSLDQSQKRSRGNLVFVGRREPRDENDSTTMTMGRTHKSSDRSSEKSRDLGRSLSIPKDNRVSSGWFKGKTSRAK